MSGINIYLLAGAFMSLIASLLHLSILFFGAPALIFFGAGERMAQMADRGSSHPGLVTLFIACALLVIAAYALVGSGISARQPLALPFLPQILLAITIIYLLRGALPFIAAVFRPEFLSPFIIWSSGVCLIFGITHALGLFQLWKQL